MRSSALPEAAALSLAVIARSTLIEAAVRPGRVRRSQSQTERVMQRPMIGSQQAPWELRLVGLVSLQERRPSVLFEQIDPPHVAAQGIERAMAADRGHFEHRRAARMHRHL